MEFLKKLTTYLVSVLGAAGIALQNYMAVSTLLTTVVDTGFAATKTGLGVIHSAAVALGGVCSGLVNLCVNIDLLEGFLERITKKKRPELEGWQKFRYWFGSAVFIITGILFGLTAVALGPVGPLVALAIAAGIFVSLVMMVQELETWLKSFDEFDPSNPSEVKKKSLAELWKQWRENLTLGKGVGTAIAAGNVIALSLLFTVGLGFFLVSVGVPALPALIVAISVAFTAGAFTEFYFYNTFLADFCHKLKDKWQELWQKTKWPGLGLGCAIANGVVNGILGYVGIMMLTSLIAAAGLALPPVGLMMALAATAAVFAGAASFILGMDFWIGNSKKIMGYFSKAKVESFAPEKETLLNKSQSNTLAITEALVTDTKQILLQSSDASSNESKNVFTAQNDTKLPVNDLVYTAEEQPNCWNRMGMSCNII